MARYDDNAGLVAVNLLLPHLRNSQAFPAETKSRLFHTSKLVTGCSQGGIGYAIAKELLSRGCRVYASARRTEAMIGLQDAGATLLQLDVLSDDSCKASVKAVLDKEGRIDVLVNNAGAGGAGPLLEFDLEEAAQVFQTNTLAPLRLAQLVSRSMIERRSGLIVNIGSVVGEVGTAWTGIYSASKAALHSLSRILEMEVKGFGVQVMLVAAGGVRSGFGGKQLNSFKHKEDTLYASVNDAILARANAGQTTSIPAEVFAARLADQILKVPSNRPSYFSTGGRALLMAILRWMPWPIARYGLMRFGQCHLVGR